METNDKSNIVRQNQQPSSKVAPQMNTQENEPYPEQIPEAQGDLADRAEIEIEQEIQEKLLDIRRKVHPQNRGV